MKEATIIGVDLARTVLQFHGAATDRSMPLRKTLSLPKSARFIAE